MGCGGSKLDDLQAVSLCRDRSQLLSDAIRHRYALADAHSSYMHSLRAVGLSLHRFFLVPDGIPPPYSPVLTLPQHRKCDTFPPLSPLSPPHSSSLPPPAVAPATVHRHSRSNSGSHLHFHSSDEDCQSDEDGHIHSICTSPLHHEYGAFDTTTTTTTYYNFARKGPPAAAVTYEQRPFSPDAHPVQVGTFGGGVGDPYGNYYGYPYSDQNQNSYGSANGGYPYMYPYPYPPAYGGMGGGFLASSSLPPVVAPVRPSATSSSSRPPPPPPSPPRASSWDFLNPFQSYENYYRTYTPSQSSKEVREDEGIPELEEDDASSEVVKEAYIDQRFEHYAAAAAAAAAASSASNGGESHLSGKNVLEDNGRSTGREMHYQARSNNGGESVLVDKNVVTDEVQRRHSEEWLQRKVTQEARLVSDVVQDIKAQFDRASMSCEVVSKILEVGKLPYHRRKYEVVSSKMMHAITPSLSTTTSAPSNSKNSEHSDITSSIHSETDEEKGLKARNLSSTLQRLYIWEKKLHEEVRAEEKMRVLCEKKCKQLKCMDEMGTEAVKVNATRALIKKLSTRIGIAIQTVESISKRISKLRDEELWPQLNELIQGLARMWHAMMESHKSQFAAIVDIQSLDAVASASAGKLTDAHMEATVLLALELLSWIESFSCWIDAQKSYVKSLNSWLLKCIHCEPEETVDGIAPFSPGRLGAPPVFVICNSWSQVMDSISGREVVEAMKVFATSVLQIWKYHYTERRQRMLTNKDMDGTLKGLEREDQKIQKAVDAVNKRYARLSNKNGLYNGDIIRLNDTGEVRNLQLGLKQIFEAMERFTESSMQAYEGLCIHSEERVAREHVRGP